MEQIATFNARDFAAAALCVSGKGEIRHYLQGVHLSQVNCDQIRLIGTNGYYMFVSHNSNREDNNVPNDGLFIKPLIKPSVKFAKAGNAVLYRLDKRAGQIKAGHEIIPVEIVEHNAPAFDSVIEKAVNTCESEEPGVSDFDPSLVAHLAKVAKALVVNTPSVKINQRGMGAAVVSFGSLSNSFMVLMPTRAEERALPEAAAWYKTPASAQSEAEAQAESTYKSAADIIA